ncbi:MAG: ABC transporter ATP-binding protein [Pseudonocardiaceae bacterium]
MSAPLLPAILKRMDAVIELRSVSKTYRRGTRAITDLTLTVRRGEVYGLVGLNGAGKTTVLGTVLGLLQPTEGTALVFGKPPGSPAMLTHTGSLLESCGYYPHLSGRRNLQLLARCRGAGKNDIDRLLERVGLALSADRRYRTYSQGMKQRLGVAGALLSDPQLLVLDEPTNGLDPAGIADLRCLIRDQAQAGGTVLLSSHLLGELEQVCDRIGILQAGKLVAQGSPDELSTEQSSELVLRCNLAPQAVRLLQADAAVAAVVLDRKVLRVSIHRDQDIDAAAATLNSALVNAGIAVCELRVERSTLETAFLALGDANPQDNQVVPV